MRAQRLAKHIERTVTGPMWHGPALAQVLDGVTAEQATARPIPGAHSIWELVLHLIVWAEIPRARLRGERLGDPTPEEDWPAVGGTSADQWRRTVERLSAAHDELAEATRGLSDEALKANVPTLPYSVSVMLRGVVEHGTYHGGQIMILRKALG